jgi:O-antigen ligase
MPLALAIMLALRSKFGWQKLVAIIPVGILLMGLYSSESRGAFIAVAAMMLLFIITSRYRVQAIAVSVLAMLTIPATFIARLQIAGNSGGNGRFDIWRSGIAAFKEHWLVGAGIGNFPTAYDNVYLKVIHKDYFSWHIQAHNLLMQTSVELGIVGIVLVFGAWFIQFRDARSLQSVAGLEDLSIALQGGIIALLVSATFLDIMWSKYTWLGFILVGLARSVVVARQRTAASKRQPSPSIGRKLCDA